MAVSIFADETNTTPKAGMVLWSKVVEEHKRRRIRPNKSGTMVGGYKLVGTRANDNVPFRSLIQLDIDTQGDKDKATGRITRVTRAAPPLDQIRSGIDDYEWCAASSHWHDPEHGIIKYRIVILPDRDIRSRLGGGWNWVGVVSGWFNPNDSGVGALERRPRHDERYHEGGGCGRRSFAFR